MVKTVVHRLLFSVVILFALTFFVFSLSSVEDIFENPQHPYTKGLLKSIPRLDVDTEEDLFTIEGTVPSLSEFGISCRFANRCPYAEPECGQAAIPLRQVDGGHNARCRCLGHKSSGMKSRDS